MNFRYLIVTILFLSFSSINFAQENSDNLKQEFEVWENSVLSKNKNSKENLFLMAKLKRDDERSATVRFAMAGIDSPYKIQVTPLKIEKDENGKFSSRKIAEPVSISTPSATKPEVFHSPIITFLAPPEANAVEISFEFGDGKSPQITLKLSAEKESVGKLTSLKKIKE